MTLQEAIEHAREVSENECEECKREHEQLAEWLEELKLLRRILGNNYDIKHIQKLLDADKQKRCLVLPKDGMIYYYEETESDKWIGNKPIQDIVFDVGWGIASISFSISEIGKTAFFDKKSAEDILKRKLLNE